MSRRQRFPIPISVVPPADEPISGSSNESLPEEALPLVPLDVFIAVSGQKPDQMAGFSRWVQRSRIGPQTVVGWKKILEQYANRPVK